MRLTPLSFGLMLAFASPALAADPVIFAAASMKTALDEIATAYKAEKGVAPVISYAGSSALAKQIEQGAPADIFISASTDWMDAVEKAGLVVEGSRSDFLGNTLVLVGHDAGDVAIADLPAKIGQEKLAMALVDSVPAGVYGKAALTHMGLWTALEPHVAQADNVRAALALVATGEAPFGIVYKTDAAAEKNVHIAATFPADSHEPITYPLALIKGGPAQDEAKAFLDYLAGPASVAVLKAQGFEVLGAK